MSIVAAVLSQAVIGSEMSADRMCVFPLTRERGAQPFPCVALDQALAAGTFEVTEVSEDGRVSELRAMNTGSMPVLLVDGEELIGAKQNRIINLSLLIPPKSKVVIPVTCVEAGRWQRRSRGFAASGNAQYARARAQKVAQVNRSLASDGAARSDQQWIWSDIAAMSSRLSAPSDTSAMDRIYERHERSIEDYQHALSPVPQQCGAIFLLNGQVVGLELFDDKSIFRAVWPKLVRSYALDAIDIGGAAANGDQVGDRRARAEAFVSAVRDAADGHENRFATVGLGETVRFESGRLAGAALVAEERLIHLAAFNLQTLH